MLFACEPADLIGKDIDAFVEGSGFAMRLRAGERPDEMVSIAIRDTRQLARIQAESSGTGYRCYLAVVREGDLLHRLASTEQRWKRLIRATNDGVVVIGTDGRVVEHNAAFVELLRLPVPRGPEKDGRRAQTAARTGPGQAVSRLCAKGRSVSVSAPLYVTTAGELYTNSLAVHYLAHRPEVPESELAKVRLLTAEPVDPTAEDAGLHLSRQIRSSRTHCGWALDPELEAGLTTVIGTTVRTGAVRSAVYRFGAVGQASVTDGQAHFAVCR